MRREDWIPIARLPPEQRDGRYVLLWVAGCPLVGFWGDYQDGGDWSTEDGQRPVPTMFAELVHPVDPGAIYDVIQDR